MDIEHFSECSLWFFIESDIFFDNIPFVLVFVDIMLTFVDLSVHFLNERFFDFPLKAAKYLKANSFLNKILFVSIFVDFCRSLSTFGDFCRFYIDFFVEYCSRRISSIFGVPYHLNKMRSKTKNKENQMNCLLNGNLTRFLEHSSPGEIRIA